MNYNLSDKIIQMVGLEDAAFFAVLKSLEGANQWFPATADNLEELTSLSRFKQRSCLERLARSGLIEIKVKGMPATRYVTIKNSSTN